ncbi:MAG: hypothetical protein JU82_10410 [Sulfuricurvum sp. MLSB]|uniref:hypothetical protein n=1 Tax=unclassified Sulfuricurvum TaxID=2632390 RepID=UPI0005012CBD|nr:MULTISPECIES: hypothetical protein [unclassified Sulfuricurvum]KFN38722.1 MAG: hypothetical protein JU82_10410 [Sulfuricurvum sp. MLSB]
MDQKNTENSKLFRSGICSYTIGENETEGEGDVVEINAQTGIARRRHSTPDEIIAREEMHKISLLEEEKQQQKALFREKIISEVQYEDRIVIFLDVLGWGNLVEKSVENTDVLTNIANIAYNAKDMSENLNSEKEFPLFSRVTNFSDSLVISLSIDDLYPQRIEFFLMPLISAALHAGMFIRGGITRGAIYHDNNMVFGPALNKAYQLESKDANYPRIIIDESVHEICYKNKIEFLKNWRKINDDYFFYDFIYTLTQFIFDSKTIVYEETINKLKQTIEENLNIHENDDRIYQKYIWLAKYFNQVYTNHVIKI